jgi:anti-sigma regulatory factor (Ser/Thr protein kinase)
VKKDTAEFPFQEDDEIFRVVLPSRLDVRDGVIRDVLAVLSEGGCRLDPYVEWLCLDELISNAIIHGNGEDPRKTVTVRAFRRRDRWGYEIADQGAGLDPETLDAHLRRPPQVTSPGGRGLALVFASGAEIRLLDGGRRVVVVRRISSGRRTEPRGEDRPPPGRTRRRPPEADAP